MLGEFYFALYIQLKDAECRSDQPHETILFMLSKFVEERINAHILRRTQMKTYQFTLILKNVDEHTPHLEDSLFEANCDDALINFRNGTVYLDFDRQASSLEEAVISAIKNVHSASINAEVIGVAPENLVTESEIAKRLQKSRQIVSLWIKKERRQSFPHPVMCLAGKSPLWSWLDVVKWLVNNNIIQDDQIIEYAFFFFNINAALEERDKVTRNFRAQLLKKLEGL